MGGIQIIGAEIIGTGGMAVTIGPVVRDGTEIRGRPPKERVVSLKGKVDIRGGDRAPMIDHGVKVYKDSEWTLKTNVRSLDRNAFTM